VCVGLQYELRLQPLAPRSICTGRSDRRANPSLENLASVYSLERGPWPEARRRAAAAIRDAIVFGVKVPAQDDSIAAACRCVLVALLQRLEAGHTGLVDELGTRIQSDRAVAFEAGALSAGLDVTFSEALQILQLAKGR
jgi:hypothetical protein